MNQVDLPNKILLVILFLVAASPVSAQTTITSQSVIAYNAVGPMKVGMTIAQAAKALGTSLVREGDEIEGCYYAVPKEGPKGIAFMFTNRRIARIDIDSKQFATERGARVGDSEQKVKSLYKGQIKTTQHPYDDTGHYLIVNMKGTRFQIIFETDGTRVTSYRTGKLPEVGYIEGCS